LLISYQVLRAHLKKTSDLMEQNLQKSNKCSFSTVASAAPSAPPIEITRALIQEEDK